MKVYDNDYHELLADPNVEAVVIALPLHLHAQVAIEAMKAGKHVLTEKLMAHNVAQCKEMGRVAKQTDKILTVGHQRHYSILYDNAVDMIRRGLIGDIHYIRAQWHRGNLPGKDSWQPPLPDDKMGKDIEKLQAELDKTTGGEIDALVMRLAQLKEQYKDRELNAENYGYQSITLANGNSRSALEELIRWRLWNRTGGGLMAELGSHQLDAAGIFISGLREDGKKALPLSVAAMGGREIFPLDRDCEDHVYCIYQFPGPKYEQDKTKTIGVTYSSINGNGFGGYGETVLGTQGTLILEREQEVMLFKDSATDTKVTVAKAKSGKPVLDTTASGGGPAAAVGKAGPGNRPSEPRLHRGNGALGLVHSQSRPGASTALQSQDGAGRRRDRADDEHRHPRESPHRVQGRMVRHRFGRDARRDQARRFALVLIARTTII